MMMLLVEENQKIKNTLSEKSALSITTSYLPNLFTIDRVSSWPLFETNLMNSNHLNRDTAIFQKMMFVFCSQCSEKLEMFAFSIDS